EEFDTGCDGCKPRELHSDRISPGPQGNSIHALFVGHADEGVPRGLMGGVYRDTRQDRTTRIDDPASEADILGSSHRRNHQNGHSDHEESSRSLGHVNEPHQRTPACLRWNQPRALPLISQQSPWLVASISWRAPRAWDRYAGHNEHRIPETSRIALQF